MGGGFISFEGIDGCGKSTQAQMLAQKLQSLGYDTVSTHEPGDTPVGQALRSLLLESREGLAWETEMLLMAADRAQHVSQVIRPALERGAFVVCDRFVDSSIAYQGYGAEKPVSSVRTVNAIATQDLEPHLTLLFALPPGQHYPRVGKADRIEERSLAYHQRVYDGFRQIAREKARMVILDVVGCTREEVAQLVWSACVTRFPQLQQRTPVN